MAFATGSLDLASRSSAEGMGVNHEPMAQVTLGENLDPLKPPTGQTAFTQRLFIHNAARGKLRQTANVDGEIFDPVPGVVEPALRNAPDQGHLATLESHTQSTAGAGRLALTAATGSAAQPAGLTVTYPLRTGFGSRPIDKVMKTHGRNQLAAAGTAIGDFGATAMPRAFASVSVSPTQATSGSV